MKENNYSKMFLLLWILLLVPLAGCSSLQLLSAATTGNVDTTRRLLEKGIDVNTKAINGKTLLYGATVNGDIEVVRLLLDRGADIDAKINNGSTPLHNAANKGLIDIVRLLIERNANINIKENTGATPLYYAVRNGHTEIARLLLEKGADVGRGDLLNAVVRGDTEIVRMLLDHVANIDAKTENGLTALHEASVNGHAEIVRMLLDHGASIDAKTENGLTALHEASVNGHAEIVRLLLNKGADVNVKAKKTGITPLLNATIIGHAEIVRMLLDHGANIDAKTENGLTALHEASVWGHTEIARILLERGADFGTAATFKDGRRGTPLQVAEGNGHTSIVRLIKEAEAMAWKPLTRPNTPKTISTSDEKIVGHIDNVPIFNAAPREYDMAIIIGIENYQGLPNSYFSKSDAGIVKDYFKALGFKERNIAFITDEKATRSGIEKAIEAWLPNKVKKDSKVYVYYSGHGAPEPMTGEAYIVPYDGDPNYLSITGYPLKRLYDKLGKLQVQEVVVLLDSCFSGSGGRSVLAKGARPLVMLPGTAVLPSNMVVLTATQGSQISTSSPEKEHGVFTYYFLKALKDGKKELSEIYDYIKPLIEDEAKSLNVSQSPSMTPESAKIKGKFNLRP